MHHESIQTYFQPLESIDLDHTSQLRFDSQITGNPSSHPRYQIAKSAHSRFNRLKENMVAYDYRPVAVKFGTPQPVTINMETLEDGSIKPATAATHVQVVPKVDQFRHDHLGWSIFTLMCCNIICGIPALVYSVRARDMNMLGQVDLAKSYSKRSKICNIIALCFGCLLIAVALGFVIYVIRTILLLPRLFTNEFDHRNSISSSGNGQWNSDGRY